MEYYLLILLIPIPFAFASMIRKAVKEDAFPTLECCVLAAEIIYAAIIFRS